MNSLKFKSYNFKIEDNEYDCNPSKSVNLLKFDLKNNKEKINDIEFNLLCYTPIMGEFKILDFSCLLA